MSSMGNSNNNKEKSAYVSQVWRATEIGHLTLDRQIFVLL